jgi:isoleucyl-tRNA synthetase
MDVARSIVELGRRIRNDARVKVRQPLQRAMVHYAGDHSALEPLLSLVAEELNVREVVFSESAAELAGWRAKPNYRALGPRLGSRVKDVAAALEADGGTLAATLARGDTVTVTVDGEEVALGPEDVDLAQETRTGWGVAAEGGLTLALDLEVPPELRLEGLARDVVRVVQDARKAAGLEVTDRIHLAIETSGDVAEAVDVHRDWIAQEVLAESFDDGPEAGWQPAHRERTELAGVGVVVALSRAT